MDVLMAVGIVAPVIAFISGVKYLCRKMQERQPKL